MEASIDADCKTVARATDRDAEGARPPQSRTASLGNPSRPSRPSRRAWSFQRAPDVDRRPRVGPNRPRRQHRLQSGGHDDDFLDLRRRLDERRPLRVMSTSSRYAVWKAPSEGNAWLVDQPREERQRRLDAGDDIFAERAAHARDRARAILGPRDEFRDHRVVEDRDVLPGRGDAVIVDASRPGRRAQASRIRPGDGMKPWSGPRRRSGTRSRVPLAR